MGIFNYQKCSPFNYAIYHMGETAWILILANIVLFSINEQELIAPTHTHL